MFNKSFLPTHSPGSRGLRLFLASRSVPSYVIGFWTLVVTSPVPYYNTFEQQLSAMPPKKKPMPPPWVASSPAPAKVKVPSVKELNKFTSSDLKGIFFTVEGIDQTHFDKLATNNFSSWEDVRTTLGVEPAVIVRLQDRLADRPEVKGWVEKPGDFAESSTPEVSPPESAAKSNISKRHAAQGLSDDVLERHKDKKHATYEAMRDVQVRKSRARARTLLRFAFHSFV